MASMVNEEIEYQTSEHAEEEEEEVERDQQDEELEEANSHIEGKLITSKQIEQFQFIDLNLISQIQEAEEVENGDASVGNDESKADSEPENDKNDSDEEEFAGFDEDEIKVTSKKRQVER